MDHLLDLHFAKAMQEQTAGGRGANLIKDTNILVSD